MTFLDWFLSGAIAHIRATFAPGSPYGAPALAGGAAFAALYYARRRWARGRRPSLRGFIRSTFLSRIILHPSSILDVWLWTLNTLVFAAAYGLLFISGTFWRDATVRLMTDWQGVHAPTPWPLWTVLVLATLLELLAYEFAYWFGHYLFHVIPSLWEFHKVHHSAEVMTVFTEMRQHPVEIIVLTNGIALCTGFILGVMTYVFGPGAHHLTLLNANIAFMVFMLTIGHLRHSHLWIPFQGWIGKLLQSPAHHQIHHSDNPAHFNKNLGFALAIWDWAFGTLYVPKDNEAIRFGVGARHIDFSSTLRLYLMPFVRAGEHLTEAVRRKPAVAPAAPKISPPKRPGRRMAA
jgi:sterol desaturase/sphingolipid hydroxylase (fatty acid hydroxylase superfamily)